MRRFGKLRSRLLSSLRKRAPRRSTDNQSRDASSEFSDSASGSSNQPSPQQLHWSEARRIYSEPASRELKVDSGSSEDTASVSSSNPSVPARMKIGLEKKRGNRGGQNMTGLCKKRAGTTTTTRTTKTCSSSGGSREDYEFPCPYGAESDGEDDDVFLESWEEMVAGNSSTAKDGSATNLSSSSGISSMRDNATSAASSSAFVPSNSPQSLVSSSPLFTEDPNSGSNGTVTSDIGTGPTPEGGIRIGGVLTGWEEWKIPSSEITLGTVLYQSQLETVYRGYWHGVVHVHTRSVKEVVDVVNFLNEVTMLNCIRHENIQLFMGASLDMQCSTVAIVMSELKGSTLSTRLHKLGHNFTAPSKTKILRQIAEGMEYLHAKGISHGLLTSASITLHSRVCISLAPPNMRHTHRYFNPQQLSYLPPECVRQLQVVQCRRLPVSPVKLASMSSLPSPSTTSCPACEKSTIASSQSRAPSSSNPSLATVGGSCISCCKLLKRADSVSTGGGGATGQHRAESQLKVKLAPSPQADIFAFGTIVYELMSLEQPYKHLQAECLIWQVGQGRTQSVALLPKGRFRNIITSCWKENVERRPNFTELLVVLEETVVPINSKSVSCSSTTRLQPSRSLPSLNSAPTTPTGSSNLFAK